MFEELLCSLLSSANAVQFFKYICVYCATIIYIIEQFNKWLSLHIYRHPTLMTPKLTNTVFNNSKNTGRNLDGEKLIEVRDKSVVSYQYYSYVYKIIHKRKLTRHEIISVNKNFSIDTVLVADYRILVVESKDDLQYTVCSLNICHMLLII
jgi:hypothetical protein